MERTERMERMERLERSDMWFCENDVIWGHLYEESIYHHTASLTY